MYPGIQDHEKVQTVTVTATSTCSESGQDSRISRASVLLSVICAVLWLPNIWADEALRLNDELYTVGSGSVLLNYQYIGVNEFQNGASQGAIGDVTTQSLYLELDYAFAERWRLKVGVPYIKKRGLPPSPHDPLAVIPPHPEISNIDDGTYHATFQDFFIDVTYLWIDKPVRVEPFVSVNIPSHDYQFFANSAVGQNLWKVEVGLELTHVLPFSDWYYRLGGGYAFVEQTLGVNVNHFRFHAEVGYFLKPNFTLNVFSLGKIGNGESAQTYPPSNRTTERWFQHDRTLKHNSVNAGIGADWFFHENYQLSANVFTTVWGDSVHWIDIAGGVGITRYF